MKRPMTALLLVAALAGCATTGGENTLAPSLYIRRMPTSMMTAISEAKAGS